MRIIYICFVGFFLFCQSAQADPIKAMSFNIRNGMVNDGANHWDKRKAMLFEVIRKYSPDVLGLQEAWDFQIEQMLAALPEYEVVGYGSEGKGVKAGSSRVFYKKSKFDIQEVKTFWLSDTPDVPSASWGNSYKRACTQLKLTNKQNRQSFYVYNTHFDHQSQQSRLKSAKFMIETMAARRSADPVIFMGDLNAGISSPEIKHLQENAQLTLVDTHFVVHPKDKNIGTFTAFQFGQFKEKIDYIFVEKGKAKVSKSIIIRDSTNERYPSDHFPIYTEISF
ncbi:MAG: endonuclease/exonuclease/phosphatase family protein [Verrucomicrobiales bacterium]|nr:endonuclease/exonuclease/phosphatase family protein [Verrucomicrobiales bacterium]